MTAEAAAVEAVVAATLSQATPATHTKPTVGPAVLVLVMHQGPQRLRHQQRARRDSMCPYLIPLRPNTTVSSQVVLGAKAGIRELQVVAGAPV